MGYRGGHSKRRKRSTRGRLPQDQSRVSSSVTVRWVDPQSLKRAANPPDVDVDVEGQRERH